MRGHAATHISIIRMRKPLAVVAALALVLLAVRRFNRRRVRLLSAAAARPLEPTDALPPLESVRVTTKQGTARGYVAQSPRGVRLANFRGVPFAQAPVGKRRFRHAEPIDGQWEPAELDCTRFGPRSVSNPTRGLEALMWPLWYRVAHALWCRLFGWGANENPADPHPLRAEMAEDCLKLNVCVAADALAAADARLPVLVFIQLRFFIARRRDRQEG